MESDQVRQRDHSDAALAESERERAELLAANERLRRSNSDLRRVQRRVVHGFAVLDERTEGQLRELVERAGDELAALVERVVDRRDGGA